MMPNYHIVAAEGSTRLVPRQTVPFESTASGVIIDFDNFGLAIAPEQMMSIWQTVEWDRTASGTGIGFFQHPRLVIDMPLYLSDMEGQSRAEELRFESLADRWRRETRHLSSVDDISMNLAYQSIIGMGDRAIPFILRDLRDKAEPDHWFWALVMITRENPVPVEEAGDMRQMKARWLDWGRKRGYISDRSNRYGYSS